MSSSFAVTVQPAARMNGRVRPPGDKSISHRYAMLAAIADGPSVIYGYSTGGDCASTLGCLRGLGVPIDQISRDPRTGIHLEILGLQVGGLHRPSATLDTSAADHGRSPQCTPVRDVQMARRSSCAST